MNESLRRDTVRIAEEAAEWMEALESGGAEVNLAFAKWLQASPRHIEEFLLVTTSDRACGALSAERNLDVDAIIAEMAENVVSLRAESQKDAGVSRGMRLRTWHRAARIAAGVAGLALVAAWSVGSFSGRQMYTAAVGEQRAVELTDGSLIHLNARSRVEVRFSRERRDIRLLEGEALFKVAHDALRPFRVQAGETVIRAVGTQFNVDRRIEATQVAVIEGRVEITIGSNAITSGDQTRGMADAQKQASSGAQFSAGEEARIVAGGRIVRSRANVAEATAWRQRRLIFRDSTLGEIASEFNRYNRTPQFVIEDDAVRAQRFGGTFDADEPDSLIAFLRGAPELVVEDKGDRLLIRGR